MANDHRSALAESWARSGFYMACQLRGRTMVLLDADGEVVLPQTAHVRQRLERYG